jgi:hypothetical protein
MLDLSLVSLETLFEKGVAVMFGTREKRAAQDLAPSLVVSLAVQSF